jgi:hypothetical protein
MRDAARDGNPDLERKGEKVSLQGRKVQQGSPSAGSEEQHHVKSMVNTLLLLNADGARCED